MSDAAGGRLGSNGGDSEICSGSDFAARGSVSGLVCSVLATETSASDLHSASTSCGLELGATCSVVTLELGATCSVVTFEVSHCGFSLVLAMGTSASDLHSGALIFGATCSVTTSTELG